MRTERPLLMCSPTNRTFALRTVITWTSFCPSSATVCPSAASMVTSREIMSVEVSAYVPCASRMELALLS